MMNKENILNDEELQNVSGGSIFDASMVAGADRYNSWEVIDDRGDVVVRCPTRDIAIAEAAKRNLEIRQIDWNELQYRRAMNHR